MSKDNGVEALVEFGRSSRLFDESADELNDAEIFRAVVNSIHEWELKRQQQQHRISLHQRHKREVSRVCYEDVGCFEDTGPFSYLEMLPSPPKEVGTRFFVYGSRKARSVSMTVPAESISDKASSAIDPELPTKVIVHGFGSSCDHVWVYEMRSVLAAVIDCNIGKFITLLLLYAIIPIYIFT
ncbi:inactive pancreatic lipase-related protein 1-like [Copidosoma floridanum]|uniref:inactive pancreatic lipase-related protein 1-like n=1 Tax=Copidosoma floridanum TaxID=29053 RepID=UPI000C6F6F12|nr:inactive pancreatic lipase-related protein 1-like [Copidosoma floridanum]